MLCSRYVFLLGLMVACQLGVAQVNEQSAYPADDVEVSSVRFAKVRSDRTRENWFEMSVELRVKGNSRRDVMSPRFLDQVGVRVGVASQLGGGASTQFNYYSCSVEASTLERGQAVFRFYLPPAVMERDGLGSPRPFAYAVRLSVAGQAVAIGRDQVSRNLMDAERLKRFWELVETEGARESGTLLPQYLTPFRDEYPGDTPVIKAPRGGAMANE